MERRTQSTRISTDASGVKTPAGPTRVRHGCPSPLRVKSRALTTQELNPRETTDKLHPALAHPDALGGALDLDCCAVDEYFGDALHQLV